jgi:hypothetical protein
MASAFSAQSKALHLYSVDSAAYLQIKQDATTLTQLNFKVQNTADGSDNDAIRPYFRNLTIRSTADSTIDVASTINAMETNITTNSDALITEADTRATADTTLQANIDAAMIAVGDQIVLLEDADTTLQSNIDALASSKQDAIISTTDLSAQSLTLSGDLLTDSIKQASGSILTFGGTLHNQFSIQNDGAGTAGDPCNVRLKPGWKGITQNSNYVTLNIDGNKTLYLWDNMEISSSLTVGTSATIGTGLTVTSGAIAAASSAASFASTSAGTMAFTTSLTSTTGTITTGGALTAGSLTVDGTLITTDTTNNWVAINSATPKCSLSVGATTVAAPTSYTEQGIYMSASSITGDSTVELVCAAVSDNAYIDFSYVANDLRGRILYNNTSNRFQIYVATTEVLRVSSTTADFYGLGITTTGTISGNLNSTKGQLVSYTAEQSTALVVSTYCFGHSSRFGMLVPSYCKLKKFCYSSDAAIGSAFTTGTKIVFRLYSDSVAQDLYAICDFAAVESVIANRRISRKFSSDPTTQTDAELTFENIRGTSLSWYCHSLAGYNVNNTEHRFTVLAETIENL